MRLQNFQNFGHFQNGRQNTEKNGDVWETFGNSILLLPYLVVITVASLTSHDTFLYYPLNWRCSVSYYSLINYFVFQTFDIAEDYSRKASCTLILISTFLCVCCLLFFLARLTETKLNYV